MPLVLFVADLLHPVGGITIKLFLNGELLYQMAA
jgi:hypothetical protein